jgi:hypothetical protein
MQLIRSDDPQFWTLWGTLRAAALPCTPLYTPLDLEYMANYPQPWAAIDLSFIVMEGDKPMAGLLLAAKRRGDREVEVSGYGRPALYLEDRDLAWRQRDAVYHAVKEEFDALLARYSVGWVLHQCREASLDPLARFLLESGASALPFFTQVVDLAPDEGALRQQIRKSYRSLINWGLKNLSPIVLHQANIQEAAFEAYRQLHVLAAGQETRPLRTWEINYEMIVHGEAFLAMGSLDGRIVTGGFFNHDGRSCYYSNGASDRALFDKPLSHCLMWLALMEAKRLGCRRMEMGQSLFARQPTFAGIPAWSEGQPTRLPGEKELGISQFKRGFGGETVVGLDLFWRPESPATGPVTR